MASFIMPQSEPIRQLFAQLMNGCQCSLSAAIYEEEEALSKFEFSMTSKREEKTSQFGIGKEMFRIAPPPRLSIRTIFRQKFVSSKAPAVGQEEEKGKKCEGKSSSSEYLMKKREKRLED